MFPEIILEWIVHNRMEMLVVLILFWSALVRFLMGPVGGSKMALFAAPPVVLVTWLWLLDLPVLDLSHQHVVTWWIVATGFAVGTFLDWRGVRLQIALIVAMVFGLVAVLIHSPSMARIAFSFQNIGIAVAENGILFIIASCAIALVIGRNYEKADGASVARYIGHFLFAFGVAYLMRLQGFEDAEVLVVGLMAANLVLPIVLGALEAGWLQPKQADGDIRRHSFPGWSGVLGLLIPLHLSLWAHTGIAVEPYSGEIGLRPAVLLTFLLFADLVIRPTRAFGMDDLRQGLAFGSRTLYLLTAGGLLTAGLFVQHVQKDLALGLGQ